MKTCERCSNQLLESNPESVCSDCKLYTLYQTLSFDKQQEIDELIFTHQILMAIKTIKDYLKIRLYDGNDLIMWRFSTLCEHRRNEFRCNLETYWDGFSTL